jgi:hypothetical protein
MAATGALRRLLNAFGRRVALARCRLRARRWAMSPGPSRTPADREASSPVAMRLGRLLAKHVATPTVGNAAAEHRMVAASLMQERA